MVTLDLSGCISIFCQKSIKFSVKRPIIERISVFFGKLSIFSSQLRKESDMSLRKSRLLGTGNRNTRASEMDDDNPQGLSESELCEFMRLLSESQRGRLNVNIGGGIKGWPIGGICNSAISPDEFMGYSANS